MTVRGLTCYHVHRSKRLTDRRALSGGCSKCDYLLMWCKCKSRAYQDSDQNQDRLYFCAQSGGINCSSVQFKARQRGRSWSISGLRRLCSQCWIIHSADALENPIVSPSFRCDNPASFRNRWMFSPMVKCNHLPTVLYNSLEWLAMV